MTKQEEIEEMAKFISNYADKHDWELHEPELEDLAIELYNAGYRKTFTNEMVSDTQKAFKEGYEKGCEACAQSWDNGYNDGFEDGKEQAYKDCYDITRKETAKEILLLLGKGYDKTEKTEFNNLQWYKEFCRELKHRYGVEVEE